MKEYRFKSATTAAVERAGIGEEQGIFWTDYYAGNGGPRPYEAAGMVEVPDQHTWHV